MRNTFRFLGFIALITVIGFSMAACDWLFDDGSPEITTKSLPDGTVGTAYNGKLAAKGNTPITWSIASGSLPTGLSLVAGTITGTPTTAAVGKATFTVKAENDIDSDTKQLTITIATALTGTVTITGTARVGQTLTANIGSLGGTGTVSYQWKRGNTASADGTDISGATSGTYTLVAADEGKYITVTVTRTGYSGSKTSTATAAVAAAPPPSAWTAVVDTKFGEGSAINGVAWGGTVNRFVAVGGEGKMAYSSDGVTWIAVPDSKFSADGSVSAIAWGNNKFVAGGYDGGAKLATSPDGITWTGAVATDYFSNIYAITWGDDKFVAAGLYGKMAYSSDGLTWISVEDSPFETSESVRAITYGDGKFVAAGGQKIAYSGDGVTWTAAADSKFTGSSTTIIRSIAWGGGKFVAGGDASQMAYSTDGITWTAITNHTFPPTVSGSSSTAIGSVVWGDNKFVAGCFYLDLGAGQIGNRTAYSTDGVTWTAGTAGGVIFSEVWASPNAIAWGNNKFVAVGGDGIFADGNIAYSATGQ